MPILTARLQACKEHRKWGTHEHIHTDIQKYVYILRCVYRHFYCSTYACTHIHPLYFCSWDQDGTSEVNLLVISTDGYSRGTKPVVLSGSTAGMLQPQTASQSMGLELMQFIKINKYRGNQVLHTCCLHLEIAPYQFSFLENIDTALLVLVSRKLIWPLKSPCLLQVGTSR